MDPYISPPSSPDRAPPRSVVKSMLYFHKTRQIKRRNPGNSLLATNANLSKAPKQGTGIGLACGDIEQNPGPIDIGQRVSLPFCLDNRHVPVHLGLVHTLTEFEETWDSIVRIRAMVQDVAVTPQGTETRRTVANVLEPTYHAIRYLADEAAHRSAFWPTFHLRFLLWSLTRLNAWFCDTSNMAGIAGTPPLEKALEHVPEPKVSGVAPLPPCLQHGSGGQFQCPFCSFMSEETLRVSTHLLWCPVMWCFLAFRNPDGPFCTSDPRAALWNGGQPLMHDTVWEGDPIYCKICGGREATCDCTVQITNWVTIMDYLPPPAIQGPMVRLRLARMTINWAKELPHLAQQMGHEEHFEKWLLARAVDNNIPAILPLWWQATNGTRGRAQGRGSLLTCGDVEQNPGPEETPVHSEWALLRQYLEVLEQAAEHTRTHIIAMSHTGRHLNPKDPWRRARLHVVEVDSRLLILQHAPNNLPLPLKRHLLWQTQRLKSLLAELATLVDVRVEQDFHLNPCIQGINQPPATLMVHMLGRWTCMGCGAYGAPSGMLFHMFWCPELLIELMKYNPHTDLEYLAPGLCIHWVDDVTSCA